MPHPIVVRDARDEEEMAALSALARRSYEEYATRMEPSAWEGLRGAVESALARAGRAKEVQKIVALRGSRIVGGVLLFPAASDAYRDVVVGSDIPELRLLSVPPEERGKGIGRRLVEECIRRAQRLGAPALGLHTSRSMAAAIELYESMGFQRHPQDDFQPEGGELVTAYRFLLD